MACWTRARVTDATALWRAQIAAPGLLGNVVRRIERPQLDDEIDQSS